MWNPVEVTGARGLLSHERCQTMQLVFEQLRAGGDRNFGYLLGDRSAGQAVLIDPSYSPEAFVGRARDQGLHVSHVLNTHGHPDHTNGNAAAVALTQARVGAHPLLRPDVVLEDGGGLEIGTLRLRSLYVPGHSADHVVLYEATHQLLITGDLLFVGKVGGTSTEADARTEWDSLQRLVKEVPATATVWPGHDYGVRPVSTMALEQATNPFLLCRDLAAFLELKATWATFKASRGLK
jgi:hydroxyacylglutathione hydrolase